MTEPAVMDAGAVVACKVWDDELAILELAALELTTLELTALELVVDIGREADTEADELDVSARDVAAEVDVNEADPEDAEDAGRVDDEA